jgi:glycerol-3-phosphate acyltransferase PlsY
MGSDISVGIVLTVIIVSYLLGSLPTAYIIAKSKNINIFEVGSGNMGGTNIARTLGIGWGLFTTLVDLCKGILAILIARALMPDDKWTATTIAAIVVIIGHNWSLFATLINTAANKGKLTVRGGKGAATALGTMLMVAPAQILLGMVAVFGALVLFTRYVSLGVLAAYSLAIVWLLVLASQGELPMQYVTYAVLLGILIAWRFRENIQRLLTGRERRLGERVKVES